MDGFRPEAFHISGNKITSCLPTRVFREVNAIAHLQTAKSTMTIEGVSSPIALAIENQWNANAMPRRQNTSSDASGFDLKPLSLTEKLLRDGFHK